MIKHLSHKRYDQAIRIITLLLAAKYIYTFIIIKQLV